MFELPEAKRVRRNDLRSPSASASSTPDPDLERIFLERLNERFDLDTSAPVEALLDTRAPSPPDPAAPPPQPTEHAPEEVLEFRLFGTARKVPTTSTVPEPPKDVARIRLHSEEPTDRPPGFVVPNRPEGYYFRGELKENSDTLARLQSVAVSGDTVREWARSEWRGTWLSWRVTHVTALGTGTGGTVKITVKSLAGEDDAAPHRRKRKGKKTRIALRRLHKAALAKQELEAQGLAEKEAAERIKRAKRNREKKMKKRERDKVKRANAITTTGSEGVEDGGREDGSSAGE